MHYKVVILGGGVAGGHAAIELASIGDASPNLCCMISQEAVPPYFRHLVLSQSERSSEPEWENELLIRAKGARQTKRGVKKWYADNHITLLLNHKAVGVDLTLRKLFVAELGSSQPELVTYDRLLIATGSRPLFTDIYPKSAILHNVFAFRNYNDGQNIFGAVRNKLARSPHKPVKIVIAGGGFIGIESAVALSKLDNTEVTITFRDEFIIRNLLSVQLSSWYQKYLAKNMNITILKKKQIKTFNGDDHGALKAITFSDGVVLKCDIVVVGVGVVLNSDLFSDCLETRLESEAKRSVSICTDRYLRTSDPFTFAAGDVTSIQMKTSMRRVEHVDHAIKSGKLAIRNLWKDILVEKDPVLHSNTFVEYKLTVLDYSCSLFNLDEKYFGFTFIGDKGTEYEKVEGYHVGDFKSLDHGPKVLFFVNRLGRVIGAVASCIEDVSVIRKIIRGQTLFSELKLLWQ